ncbi:unnamed protein product [Peniophora sp. CBMAI 1063]|nr:unnamed protein product [Peniophora sp. CBMAI 1063]
MIGGDADRISDAQVRWRMIRADQAQSEHAQSPLVSDLHLRLGISSRIELAMNHDAFPMNDGMDFDEPFAKKITREVVILPSGWSNVPVEQDPEKTKARISQGLDRAYVDASERWEKSPEAALEPLFRLHDQLKMHPCGPNMSALMQYGAAFYKETGRNFANTGSERWYRAIDAGLLDFCQQVLDDDNTLSQIYATWTLKFFEILESMMYAIDDRCKKLPDGAGRHSPLRARVLSLANQLWRGVDKRPYAFVCTHWNNQSKEMYQLMLTRLLLAASKHMSATDPSGESLGGPEYGPFRRVALFGWFQGHNPTDTLGLVESLLVLPFTDLWPAPFRTPFDIPEDEPPQFTTFIKEEILDVYGPRAYLDRLEISLRHPQHIDARLLFLFKIIGKTIVREEFAPHVQAAGTFWSMRQAVDRQMMKGARDDMELFMILYQTLMIFSLFTHISSVSEGAAHLIKECDVIELLSLTIVLAVRIQPLVPLGYTGLTCCLHPMQVWTELGHTLSMRSGRNLLLKAFKHAVRREWYPTLATLHTLPKGGLSHNADRDDFVQAWYELGMTVGLDESKEREEYERFGKRAARSCSWKECRYHTEAAPNPSRVCVGCGEVRYCGKPCQTKDWKEGQHKKRCKRIKDKPSVPRETAQIYGLIQ